MINKRKESQKAYYEKHKEEIKRRHRNYERRLRIEHPEKIKERQRNFYLRHKEEIKIKRKQYGKQIKLKAMQMVSGLNIPHCENCYCDNIEILEVAHKNHDGNIERKILREKGGYGFYLRIVKGKRNIIDLKVLCRLCNQKEYIENRFKEFRFKVLWLE